MERKLYQHIASCVVAMANCAQSGNSEWYKRHRATVEALVDDYMPSGSGIDNGTQFDFENSSEKRLTFNTAFHRMNDGGMYDGWTEHVIRVTPSFDDIKDYLHDVFGLALGMTTTDAEWRHICNKAA